VDSFKCCCIEFCEVPFTSLQVSILIVTHIFLWLQHLVTYLVYFIWVRMFWSNQLLEKKTKISWALWSILVIPATWDVEAEGSWPEGSLSKNIRPSLKNKLKHKKLDCGVKPWVQATLSQKPNKQTNKTLPKICYHNVDTNVGQSSLN
jgi:hypothetical protein